MPAQGLHIIQQQVFELSAASSKNNFEWEERAAAYLHQVINPVIEACFRNIVTNDQHLVIDKIEIDLGSFTTESFKKEAGERLQQKLDDVLKSYLKPISTDAVYDYETGIHEYRSYEKELKKRPLISHARALQLAFEHFLLKGRFPWWFTTSNIDAITAYHLTGITQVNETTGSGLISANHPQENSAPAGLLDDYFKTGSLQLSEPEIVQLKEVLRTSSAARLRLVNHFSAHWIASFLQWLGLSGKEAMHQWITLFYPVRHLRNIVPLFHQYFWLAWIESAFHGIHSINITLLVERTTSDDNAAMELAKRFYEACFEKKHETVYAGYVESIRKYFAEESHYDAFRKKFPGEIVAGENAFASKQSGDDELNSIDKTIDEILEPSEQKKRKNSLEDDDALFIEAAGIVILHPFLAELFKETGLWDEEKWCMDESVYRAVQLLSYLVYGEDALPEHRLLLFKILTALDIEEPLPAITPLTQQEKAACNELLDAIIRHWKALRSTSIDGLQQGFLQREGKISQTEKGYQLVVERKAQDVLLSHLPWGYSMIKLPWMEQMLNVTWI